MIRVLYVKKKGLCVPALLVIIVIIAVKYSSFKSPTDYSITIIPQSAVIPKEDLVSTRRRLGRIRDQNTTKSVAAKTHRSFTVTGGPIPAMDYKMHIVTYYHSLTLRIRKSHEDKDKISAATLQRVKEELFALQKNLNHPHVKMVHLLAENGTTLGNFLKKGRLGGWFKKIHIHDIGRNARMKDAFQYISNNLLNATVMLVNGDIYLGKGFDRINVTQMSEQKIMYALTRHNSPEESCTLNKATCNELYVGAHDAFMINLVEPIPQAVLKEIDYDMGVWGSENRLMWAFKTLMNFCLLNPCSILTTFHYHCSESRPERIQVSIDGKRALAYPTTRLTCE